MRRGWLLLVLTACGSAPRVAQVSAVAAPAAPPHVEPSPTAVRVRFEGAVQVSPKELARVVCIDKRSGSCRVPEGVTHEEVIERDALLLMAAYYDRGFVMAKVDHRVEPTAGGIEVVYTIEEHDPYEVRSFVLREEDERRAPIEMIGSTKAWNDRFAKLVGARFNRGAVAAELEKLRHAYRDAGYATVEAEPKTEVDTEKHTIALTVAVRRGDSYVIERVRVSGDERGVARPLAQPLEGTPYGDTKLEELKRALEAKGFGTVGVSMKISGPGKLEIGVEVE